MRSINLDLMSPRVEQDLDRYLELLNSVRESPEINGHLPEIFEEKTIEDVASSIISTKAIRFFINSGGVDIGRLELTRHLNNDPSIKNRIPLGVNFGFNTCYFIDESKVEDADATHKETAALAIMSAFSLGDKKEGKSPWIPVSLDGKDVSRGWLMQDDNLLFSVNRDQPKSGIFPQFGIGDNEYSIAYAELSL